MALGLTEASTLAEVVAAHVATVKARVKAKLAPARAPKCFTIMARKLGTLADRPVGEVTTDEVEGWRKTIAELYAPLYAKQICCSLNSSLAFAREHGLVLRGLGDAPPAPGTVAAAALAWRAHLKERAAGGTLADDAYERADLLLRELDELAGRPVTALDQDEVRAWYLRHVEGSSERRAHKLLIALGSLLTWQRQMGVTTGTPTHGIEDLSDDARQPSHRKKERRPKKLSGRRTPRGPLDENSTVDDAIDHWLAFCDRRRALKPPQLKQKTLESYEYGALKIRTLPAGKPLGTRRPCDLTPFMVNDWYLAVCETAGRGAGKACMNRLRILFKFIKAHGLMAHDPTYGVRVDSSTSKPRPPTLDELRELRKSIELLYVQRDQEGQRRRKTGRELAAFLAPNALARALLFCGTRIDEMARLECRNTTRNGAGGVELVETKTGRDRKIGVDAGAAAIIKRQIDLVVGDFSGWGGGPVEGPVFPCTSLDALKDATARVMWKACELAGLAKPFPHPHDLRHGFVHNAIELGVDETVIMNATGHISKKRFEIYKRGALDPRAAAIPKQLEAATQMDPEKLADLLLQGVDKTLQGIGELLREIKAEREGKDKP